MIIKCVILGIIIFIYIFYRLYLREYFNVKKTFSSLRNFLDIRDTLVLKLIPDIKDDKLNSKIVKLIEERRLNFMSSYNNAIKSDVKLNSELRNFYEKVNKSKLNELTIEIFSKIINMEKDLKNIRNKYTIAVEKYNENLIKHKFMCLKLIRMKPLDTYKVAK